MHISFMKEMDKITLTKLGHAALIVTWGLQMTKPLGAVK